MANEVSNYGVSLTFNGVAVGEITNIEPPEIIHEQVEITNHASGGWKQFIPGGLKEAGEMSFSMDYVLTAASGLYNAEVNGTPSNFVLTFPNSKTMTFSGYVSNFKTEAADAQSPEALTCTVTVKPTGPVS